MIDRPRAVFSSDDFDILRNAVNVYAQINGGNLTQDELKKVAHLYHRLNRLNGSMVHPDLDDLN